MLAALITSVTLMCLAKEGHLVTPLGHVALSGPIYVDASIYYRAFSEQRMVKTINLIPGLSRAWAVMHCTRECLKIEDCHSFVLTSSSDICYLTNFSRCAEPTFVLYRKSGFQTYDVRRERNSLDETCFDACGSCDDCGRSNCRGLLCDDCAYACWDEDMGSKRGFQHLWPKSNPVLRRDIECDGFWQKVWGSSCEGDVEFSVYDTLLAERVTLRLTITYDDGDTIHSFFDSFEYSEDSISVGKYLKGNAGNFWEAPFTQRALVATKDCLAFFYAEGSCPAPPGEEPVYYWQVNDLERNSQVIQAIELWITEGKKIKE